MRALRRAAIALPAAILLAACDSGTDERGTISPDRSAGVHSQTATPERAPAGKIDLSRLRRVQFAFGGVDSLMHYSQPTTPKSMTRLASKVESLARSIRTFASEGMARDAALLSLQRLETQIHQGLVIWSEERTLATMRHRWIEIRERHFWPAEEMRVADPGLEAAQRVRNPDGEFNLIELLRRGEGAWQWVESLLHEMQDLPEDERYIAFNRRAHGSNQEFTEWYRQRPLRVPREGPLIVRRAWNAFEMAQTGVLQLISLPWGRTFEEYAPDAIRGRAEKLRKVREDLEAYFEKAAPEAT